jgi:hypothetical protein
LGTTTDNLTITNPDGSTHSVTGIDPSHVLTGASGTLTIASILGLGSNDYVVAPGSDGTVNIAASLATANTVWVGGSATVNSTISALSNLTLNVDGGTATTGSLAGALSGTTVNLENGGTFSNGSSLANVLTGTTINFGDGGGTFVVNVGGAPIDLSSTTINGFDAGADKLQFENLAGTVDHYTITSQGSSQTLELFDNNNQSLGAVTTENTNFTSGSYHVGDANSPISLSENGGDVTISAQPAAAPCYVEGTRILTPRGEVAVEALKASDIVITASGQERLVIWVGQKTVRPARHAHPHEVNPVRIRKGAFGEGLPLRDLRVSPGHAVFVDGVLVPAGHLANGATIVQEEVERVRYFHVELDAHDVLIADGLPCESYLDDGNRMSFANAGESVEMLGRLDPKSWDDACAPMVAAGPQLTAIQQRLHTRAEELGWLKSDHPDLLIEADGTAITPLHQVGNRYWFWVSPASVLMLRSNAGVLAHLMPGISDRRRLGVAVASLRVNGMEVALDSETFGAGFYVAERHDDHGWRWTNGEGVLSLALGQPAMIEIDLAMVAPGWKRRAPVLKLVQVG